MAPESSWWDHLLQSWGPFIGTIGSSVMVFVGRQLWVGFFAARTDEQKQDKEDEKQRRNLLRSIDSRAEVELKRAWDRNDAFTRENDALRRDRDRGWDLARAWREMTLNERHARNNLLMITGGASLADLPSLEDVQGVKP